MNPLNLVRESIRTLQPYTIDDVEAEIKLDANESPFDPLEELPLDVIEELRRVHVNRYPDPGATELKKHIASFFGTEPEAILLGNGSDELIGYLITTFTGNGKGVLFPTPTFSMYGIIAKTLGQPVIEFPLNHKFQLDTDLLIKTIQKENPQIVFLASPNNPTGIAIPEDHLVRIIEHSDTLVVVDEAYIDYTDQPGLLKDLQAYPNLIVLRTLSKIGMAALRIGILTAGKEILQELEKVRLPYNINSFSQAAATMLLKNPEVLQKQIKTLVQGRSDLSRSLSQIREIELFNSQANFLLFRTHAAQALYQYLIGQGILVRNLNNPGALEGCLRVTVGTPKENKRFLEATRAFFEKR